MEAAYGLAITMCMIATSLLFANYLVLHRAKSVFVYLYLAVYLTIETAFLFANIDKFPHGGYVTLIDQRHATARMYAAEREKTMGN